MTWELNWRCETRERRMRRECTATATGAPMRYERTVGHCVQGRARLVVPACGKRQGAAQAAVAQAQGLTLVHFSAQLEPCLTQEYTLQPEHPLTPP